MIAFAGIAKAFAGVPALSDVSLTLAAGQVHGLLGENGAGKSTLVRILFGLERADAGTIAIAGKPVVIRSPRDARGLGLGMVHQHLALVPTLDVVDNLALTLQSGLGAVPRRALAKRLVADAAVLGWQVDPHARVGNLAMGQQQRVEILAALAGGSRALILDEPTAVLTPQEVDELLPALRRLAAAGRTIVLISHKLHEVGRVCDTVSILRRGRLVHHGRSADLDHARMAELMLGAPPPPPSTRPAARPGAERLNVSGLVVSGRGGRPAVDGATFAVRAGETVGIAGVDGNGQAELVAAVLGLGPHAAGVITIRGAGGIGYIPDDRHRHALLPARSVRDNLLLRDRRRAPYTRRGWLDLGAWAARAHDLVTRYDVRPADIALPAAALSGGNQQKVVVARELDGAPGLIVAVNPTRGLDIAASAFVLAKLDAARDAGAAVALVHSDLDELLAHSDRVLVLCAGRLADSGWPDADRARIGRMMLGLPPEAAA